MRDTTVYLFDEFELDLGAWRLSRAGTPVALEPRAIEVLALLVERAGEVVAKNEILDLGVEGRGGHRERDGAGVANLRSALGDDAREPRYIETVHTRGYRFVAPVARRSVAPSGPRRSRRPTAAAGERGRTPLAIAAAVAVAVVLAAIALVVGPRAARPSRLRPRRAGRRSRRSRCSRSTTSAPPSSSTSPTG